MEKFDSIQNVINTSSSQQQLNGIQTCVEDSKQTKTTTKVVKLVELKKASVFRLMMKLTFSNFGLVLIICMYACLGALMFRLLEQHEELRRCEECEDMEKIYDFNDLKKIDEIEILLKKLKNNFCMKKLAFDPLNE